MRPRLFAVRPEADRRVHTGDWLEGEWRLRGDVYMGLSANFGRVVPLLIVGGLMLTIVHDAIPQGQGTPEGYIPRGTRPGKGLAPGLQVQDLGKNGRTYRVS